MMTPVRGDLPSGTVTFLFTDVEGSTELLHKLGSEAYAAALAEHRRVIRETCASQRGVEVDTQGDAFFFAFPTAPGAIAAAEAMTKALAQGSIQVRIGLHTGAPLLTEEGYVGGDVHRAARIAAVGHGGQVLISSATAQLVEVELEDLGEHRLKDLSAAERIYQLGEEAFPALKSLYRTNLPISSTPFLGREAELTEVASLLASSDTRLLTLTGPGGTGKTRLAAQAAGLVSDSYADGVWWIPLSPLRDPKLVLATAAQIVGSKNGLAGHIQDKEMLCLFDNFEQVVEAAADVAELLASCPNLHLLITSREPLHVTGEQEYAVPPFVHEEGVGFFLARARAVKADFEADEAVSEICRRLDDLPLALELAAARVKALTSTQILERLEHRLPLLTGGARDLPERQRTLQAAIEWSYDLLGEEEQRLFCRLSVFSGGCTLEAAGDVCDADLDTLQSLVDKSLVRFTNGRYSMLETIREYAAVAMAASPDAENLERRHAEHYLRLALEAEPELSGPAQALWFDRLGDEHDNLRAALDWSLTADPEVGLRIAVSLVRYWGLRGHVLEEWNYLSRLIALDPSQELRARALGVMTAIAAEEGEWDAAERYAEERGRLYRELGDEEGVIRALQNVGYVAELRGDLDRAKAVYQEVLPKVRELGMDVGIPLRTLGAVARKQGRFSDAEALYEEALAYNESIGDEASVAFVCVGLAEVHVDQGRFDMARARLRRALSLLVPLRSPGGIGWVLDIAAVTATDAKSAARLLGKSDELLEETGEPRPPQATFSYEQAAAAAVDALGEERFDAEYAAGRALSLDDAVALALEVIDA
jgi:predicted ATPase/class 3 adenylate cyclase